MSAWQEVEDFPGDERIDLGELLTVWVSGHSGGFMWVVGTECDGEPNEPIESGTCDTRAAAKGRGLVVARGLLHDAWLTANNALVELGPWAKGGG